MMIKGQQHLDGVHPTLVRIVKHAASICPKRFAVIEGLRSQARQIELYAKGRTTDELKAAGLVGILGQPGPKVTWTLRSAHIAGADGYGRAVDIAPLTASDGIDWNDLAAFDAIAFSMFRAASAIGARIRWGADWDGDGKFREKGESDRPHFELGAKT